jgi:hypothetical protein
MAPKAAWTGGAAEPIILKTDACPSGASFGIPSRDFPAATTIIFKLSRVLDM